MKTPRLSSRQLLIYLNPWYSTIEKLVIAPILINSHWICKNHLIKPGLVVSKFRLWKLMKITTKVFYSLKSVRSSFTFNRPLLPISSMLVTDVGDEVTVLTLLVTIKGQQIFENLGPTRTDRSPDPCLQHRNSVTEIRHILQVPFSRFQPLTFTDHWKQSNQKHYTSESCDTEFSNALMKFSYFEILEFQCSQFLETLNVPGVRADFQKLSFCCVLIFLM